MSKSSMSSSEMLVGDIGQWIIGKIGKLEGRAKYSAANAVRFLRWSNDTFDTSPIVAAFCAMHATEEAVSAFISAAKEHGHKKYAKKINLHNHKQKALVSIFAQRTSLLLAQEKVAIAMHPKEDALAYRMQIENGFHYDALHLSSFSIGNNVTEAEGFLLGDTPSLDEIASEADRLASLRNKLIYATENGLPSGFINPKYELARNTGLSLGLIWAAVDMCMHPDHDRLIIDQILSGMAQVIPKKGGKSCSEEDGA